MAKRKKPTPPDSLRALINRLRAKLGMEPLPQPDEPPPTTVNRPPPKQRTRKGTPHA